VLCRGFEIIGGNRICNSAGNWVNTPYCQPARCGGGNIPNSAPGGCKGAILNSGQYCNFNCDNGYVLRNSGEIYGKNTGATVGGEAARRAEG
jgi:hypothetical protein